MVYTRSLAMRRASSSGVLVARSVCSAWASVLAPPQTEIHNGRGSSLPSASMIRAEPAESLPGPTPAMPYSGEPVVISPSRNAASG
ncbi:MAG: hypothetical protein BWX86_02873 [Verrucomicrobia bacterium ADurb.Bin122]|nr:MAG: hypothetical protein BWX86_02873 [Verrucomicrobia bacterium ADurb.Bin122]